MAMSNGVTKTFIEIVMERIQREIVACKSSSITWTRM